MPPLYFTNQSKIMLLSHFQSIIHVKKFSITTFHYSFVVSATQAVPRKLHLVRT